MKLINVVIIFILSLLLSGCLSSTANNRITNVIEINKENKYTELEKQLILIAKENKRLNNEYVSILTKMKKHTKLYDNTKIPKRLARRMTFHYDGPALVLLKTIAEETDYKFDYASYRTFDSKNIVRYYRDTMLIDIIQDIAAELSMNVLISESNERITLQER